MAFRKVFLLLAQLGRLRSALSSTNFTKTVFLDSAIVYEVRRVLITESITNHLNNLEPEGLVGSVLQLASCSTSKFVLLHYSKNIADSANVCCT